jgi:hypothetical protein
MPVRARIPKPFERFSKIAFGLIMAVSFTGVRGGVQRQFASCGVMGERSHFPAEIKKTVCAHE